MFDSARYICCLSTVNCEWQALIVVSVKANADLKMAEMVIHMLIMIHVG